METNYNLLLLENYPKGWHELNTRLFFPTSSCWQGSYWEGSYLTETMKRRGPLNKLWSRRGWWRYDQRSIQQSWNIANLLLQLEGKFDYEAVSSIKFHNADIKEQFSNGLVLAVWINSPTWRPHEDVWGLKSEVWESLNHSGELEDFPLIFISRQLANDAWKIVQYRIHPCSSKNNNQALTISRPSFHMGS